MAGSTSNLDLITTAQAQKEVTANALFDAASAAMLFGRRSSQCAGLSWGFYGGALMVGGTPTLISNGSLALTANATNYVEVISGASVVSRNTTGFTTGALALYSVITGAAAVTSYTDFRVFMFGATAGPAVQPYDLACFTPGKPTASMTLITVPMVRDVSFPAGFTDSKAHAGVDCTSSAYFDILLNDSSVGTLTFSPGTAVGSFSGSSTTVLVAGDVLSVVAPVSPDDTLSDISFVLKGTH